jgi:hypothetical protein
MCKCHIRMAMQVIRKRFNMQYYLLLASVLCISICNQVAADVVAIAYEFTVTLHSHRSSYSSTKTAQFA